MTSSSIFLRSGNGYTPTSTASLDMHEVLPGGNYTIKQHPMNGPLYFDRIDSFPPLGKVYGSATSQAGRIMNTFNDRANSTGVLLSGEKGSGKTMLAKSLALMGEAAGMPTIVINAPWHGDAFNLLMQTLKQPAIVLFDEFEKVYDKDQQAAMLTFLDGVYPSKKLYVLTCNDQWRIDSHMRNRPGRIFYMLEFDGLEPEFIREYCVDKLKNAGHIEEVVRVGALFDAFNFDMLKALVEEMNRYNEDPQAALKMLNAKPGQGEVDYDVKLTYRGVEVTQDDLRTESWEGSPAAEIENIHIGFNWRPSEGDTEYDMILRTRKARAIMHAQHSSDAYDPTEDNEEDRVYKVVEIAPTDLKHMDPDKGTFTYQTNDAVVVFTRRKKKGFAYNRYAF